MPEDIDDQVSVLVQQLKDNSLQMKGVAREEFSLKKEDTENFVIQKAGELVAESLDLVKYLKPTIGATGDPEAVDSLAKLVGSTAAALEALNKLMLQEKKIKGMKEIKQMEIDAKMTFEEEPKPGELTMRGTREEIFKQLMKKATVVDVESTSTPSQTIPASSSSDS